MRSGGEKRTLATGDVGLFAAPETLAAVFVHFFFLLRVLRAAGVIKPPPLSIEPMGRNRARLKTR
jgi:hypothetical protein